MQMMYETIYKALVEVGLEDAFSPQDYLNFYCLGNREEFSEDDPSTAGSPGAGTPQVSFFYLLRSCSFYDTILFCCFSTLFIPCNLIFI